MTYDSLVITISFNESSYSVGEEIGILLLKLVLSNPSSTDITVIVFDIVDSATSKYYLYT